MKVKKLWDDFVTMFDNKWLIMFWWRSLAFQRQYWKDLLDILNDKWEIDIDWIQLEIPFDWWDNEKNEIKIEWYTVESYTHVQCVWWQCDMPDPELTKDIKFTFNKI